MRKVKVHYHVNIAGLSNSACRGMWWRLKRTWRWVTCKKCLAMRATPWWKS